MDKNRNINIPVGYLDQTTFIYYKSEMYKFSKEINSDLNSVKKNLSIDILCPIYWQAFGNKQKNLRWNKYEILSLLGAIMKVPNLYKKKRNTPKKILLLKCPNSFSNKIGGGYDSGTIAIYIPKHLFEKRNKLLYVKNQLKLRSTLIHEWSHCFIEKNISLFKKWVFLTNWTQNIKGKWENISKERILMTHASADKYPTEDFAVSVSLINTEVKPKLPKNIIDFFIEHKLIYESKNKLPK